MGDPTLQRLPPGLPASFAAADDAQRAELLRLLAALAYEDPLTGLANRRALEDRLEAAVGEAVRSGGKVALMFCDLDALKELNDSAGHEAGDRALMRVAAALTAAAEPYPGAFISRIGGDEFCVLLEGHDTAAARELALAAERLLSEGRTPLSISSGASELQHAGQRPADLFRAADAAQYVAKRTGRGRVVVAESGALAVASARARAAGRRRLRDAARQPTLPERVLAVLDGDLADASPADRLEAVAVMFADAFDASHWAVSVQRAGEPHVRTEFEAGRRAHRVSGVPSLRFSGLDDLYALADYPSTAAIMARGGSFWQDVDDPEGDPAEQEIMRHYGYDGVLAAAVVHGGDGWLLELFSDARTGALDAARAELRLLVGEAVRAAGCPPSVHEG